MATQHQASVWSYDGMKTGPDSNAWPHFGEHQSPIDIDTSKVVKVPATYEPLEFFGYDNAKNSITVLNNGHTGIASITYTLTVFANFNFMSGPA
jgi:carbonic anhydrase